jgi:hypothetical protein
MTVHEDSPAVQVAWAQVRAWSNHDLAAARAAVADHAAVAVTTTQAEAPAVNTVVNTTGIDDYMAGLENFLKSVTPGSLKEIGALGDDRNALLMFTVEADYGAGKVTLPNARLYLLDEDGKITAEQVVCFFTSR